MRCIVISLTLVACRVAIAQEAVSPQSTAGGVEAASAVVESPESLRDRAEAVAKSSSPYDAVPLLAELAKKSPYWRQVSLVRRAQICSTECETEAFTFISEFEDAFPESPQMGEIEAVKLGMAGVAPQAIEYVKECQQAATNLIDVAQAALRAGQTEFAVAGLDVVVGAYHDVPASTKAADLLGHALLRLERREEAERAFRFVLEKTYTPGSRSSLRQRAQLRLAALRHRQGDRQAARQLYSEVQAAGGPDAGRVELQLAGLSFEELQHGMMGGRQITRNQWGELKNQFEAIIYSATASGDEKRRAELMLLEVFSWEENHQATIASATVFLEQHATDATEQELATVHFFAGDSAFWSMQYDLALHHLCAVLETSGDKKEIWKGMDHVPRTMYRIWEVLRAAKAPAQEIDRAAEDLVERFPDSEYVKALRLFQQHDAIMRAMAEQEKR